MQSELLSENIKDTVTIKSIENNYELDLNRMFTFQSISLDIISLLIFFYFIIGLQVVRANVKMYFDRIFCRITEILNFALKNMIYGRKT